MKDKHIDDMTMSLYLGGGSNLKRDLVEWVQLHLKKCDLCSKKLETKLNEMANQPKSTRSKELNLELNVLDKIITLLSLPLKSPSCWDKLKELCGQLVDTISDIAASPPQDKNKQRLSLVTTGYRYTRPSNEKTKPQGKQEIGERVLSLLEILGDDEVPITERIKLSEELLLYAEQKSKEFKDSSSCQKADEPNRKKDND